MYNEEMREIFVVELSDIIELTQNSINKLRKNPQDEEAIKITYTNYHKLKGNSAIFELENLKQFCYLFELEFKNKKEIGNALVNQALKSIEIFEKLYVKYKKNDFSDLDLKIMENFKQEMK